MISFIVRIFICWSLDCLCRLVDLSKTFRFIFLFSQHRLVLLVFSYIIDFERHAEDPKGFTCLWSDRFYLFAIWYVDLFYLFRWVYLFEIRDVDLFCLFWFVYIELDGFHCLLATCFINVSLLQVFLVYLFACSYSCLIAMGFIVCLFIYLFAYSFSYLFSSSFIVCYMFYLFACSYSCLQFDMLIRITCLRFDMLICFTCLHFDWFVILRCLFIYLYELDGFIVCDLRCWFICLFEMLIRLLVWVRRVSLVAYYEFHCLFKSTNNIKVYDFFVWMSH